jgi:hypothetical protein
MYFANSDALLGAVWHQPLPMVSEKIRAANSEIFIFSPKQQDPVSNIQ